MNKAVNPLLTITEAGMLAYWLFAALVALEAIDVPPQYMYSDHQNPLIVTWNWSFFPIDVLFALSGLASRFLAMSVWKREFLTVVSLSLMFCAGLMAISFWAIQQTFDPFWWGMNFWLIILSFMVLTLKFRQPKSVSG